ncbi:MAG: hypothetical protein IPG64_27100 [Haliea sp.]|nr:hypothetical protein [Haliea sp.]
MEITAAIHDLSPDYARPRDHHDRCRQPTFRAGDGAGSQLNAIRKPFHLFSVARNTVPGLAKVVAGLSKGQLTRIKDATAHPV